MQEYNQPQIVTKEVTEQQLLWVKQLSRAVAVTEQVEATVGETLLPQNPDRHVTMWTRSEPEATPVFLRANHETPRALSHVIFSRYVDLAEEGLGDVALNIVQGASFRQVKDASGEGADVAHRPSKEEQRLQSVRDELAYIQKEAREDGERDWAREHQGDDDEPPYELLGDGLEDMDDTYISNEDFRRQVHEGDDPQLPNEFDGGVIPF